MGGGGRGGGGGVRGAGFGFGPFQGLWGGSERSGDCTWRGTENHTSKSISQKMRLSGFHAFEDCGDQKVRMTMRWPGEPPRTNTTFSAHGEESAWSILGLKGVLTNSQVGADFGPSESKSPGGLRSVQLGRDPGWGTKTVVFTCWRCGMGQNPRCLSLVGGGTESKK